MFPAEEHAARDALRVLSGWLIDQRLQDLPGDYAVLGINEQNKTLLKLRVTVDMEKL